MLLLQSVVERCCHQRALCNLERAHCKNGVCHCRCRCRKLHVLLSKVLGVVRVFIKRAVAGCCLKVLSKWCVCFGAGMQVPLQNPMRVLLDSHWCVSCRVSAPGVVFRVCALEWALVLLQGAAARCRCTMPLEGVKVLLPECYLSGGCGCRCCLRVLLLGCCVRLELACWSRT